MRLPTRLSRRRPDTHKGDFGHVFIVAGSPRYSGAAVLAATAALRTGAGMVTVGMPRGILTALLRVKPPEIMLLPLAENADGTVALKALADVRSFLKRSDVLLIGPGLGTHESTRKLIRSIVKNTSLPLVLDADGLNALARQSAILKRSRADLILTPHSGEMARLLGVSARAVQSKRKEIAQSAARAYNTTVILKGHRTVVAEPAGSYYINTTGNAGMATAGSGDVLAGMVAALRGQHMSSYEAACCGVYLHGLAGDLAAADKTEPGMIATDIINHIPDALKLLLNARAEKLPA